MSKFRKRKGGGTDMVPDGEIRRSQMVFGYGPGAMIDFVDAAVVNGGLDDWQYGGEAEKYVVNEPRLRDAIVDMFKKFDDSEWELSPERPFYLPPECDGDAATTKMGVKAHEFPKWFVCQNPGCRALAKRQSGLEFNKGRNRWQHRCDTGGLSDAVPVRFVMACKNGHLADVPWNKFVHKMAGYDACGNPELKIREGASGNFSDVLVSCSCPARHPLGQIMAPGMEPTCYGEQPWLGGRQQEECDEKLRLLVRTASNSYFALTKSALTIPDSVNLIFDAVRPQASMLEDITRDSAEEAKPYNPVWRKLCERYPTETLLDVLDALRANKSPERESLRFAEYKTLVGSPEYQRGDFPKARDDNPDNMENVFWARSHGVPHGLGKHVVQLVIAERLREVKAQYGFTRLEAPVTDMQGDPLDLHVKPQPLSAKQDWLPAVEVRGEGVFIRLDMDAVQAWEQRDAVVAREEQLKRGYFKWAQQRYKDKEPPPFRGVRYYMLHTLSHMLMEQIAMECGYSASALSERLYCGGGDKDKGADMAGILIKTGSPGSEGTLGGLIAEGKRLAHHMRAAWQEARLCSNDPLCAKHQADSEEERYLDGASCYACTYLPEVSCEAFNQYLDRALVVPTMAVADAAFFRERP